MEGLILRERHRWAGSEVRAYIQPTKLALQYMGRPGDLDRLLMAVGKVHTGTTAGTGAGTGAVADYTSFSFSSTKSSKKKGEETELPFGEGKGSAATSGSPPPQTLTPQSPPLTHDMDAFPVLQGKHEKAVQHPSVKFPNWSSFSTNLKSEIYATYESHVANWYKGKQGKPYVSTADVTDEEWEKFGDDLEKWLKDNADEEISNIKALKLKSAG